jgi:hypothetical protein
MAPSRTAAAAASSRGKYNYTEETLAGRLSCPHCDKKFKPQGFKKHEATCKRRANAEREQEIFGLEYQKDQQRGELILSTNQSLASMHLILRRCLALRKARKLTRLPEKIAGPSHSASNNGQSTANEDSSIPPGTSTCSSLSARP